MPARKSLLTMARPIPSLRLVPVSTGASIASGAAGRLFLARLHQAGFEQDRIELDVVVLPALIGRLGITRIDDEAGLFRFGLELGIPQCSENVRFQERQAVGGDAFRRDDAAPGADDDVVTLLA